MPEQPRYPHIAYAAPVCCVFRLASKFSLGVLFIQGYLAHEKVSCTQLRPTPPSNLLPSIHPDLHVQGYLAHKKKPTPRTLL